MRRVAFGTNGAASPVGRTLSNSMLADVRLCVGTLKAYVVPGFTSEGGPGRIPTDGNPLGLADHGAPILPESAESPPRPLTETLSRLFVAYDQPR